MLGTHPLCTHGSTCVFNNCMDFNHFHGSKCGGIFVMKINELVVIGVKLINPN